MFALGRGEGRTARNKPLPSFVPLSYHGASLSTERPYHEHEVPSTGCDATVARGRRETRASRKVVLLVSERQVKSETDDERKTREKEEKRGKNPVTQVEGFRQVCKRGFGTCQAPKFVANPGPSAEEKGFSTGTLFVVLLRRGVGDIFDALNPSPDDEFC